MSTPRREPLLSPEEVKAILETSNYQRHLGLRTAPEPIDLLACDRMVAQMLPALSVGYVRLSETLRKVLTSTLRMKIEVRDEVPEILTGRGLSRVTERSACMIAMSTTVLGQERGYSMLILDPTITYTVIERVFGSSSGGSTTAASRPPTTLEQRMLMRTLSATIDALNRTLEPPGAFQFRADRVESTLELVPGFAPDTTVLHIPFALKIGEQSANMSLAMPTSILDPLRPLLCAPLNESLTRDVELPNLIKRVPVQLSVELGRTSLPLRDVLNLEVGMVLSLDKHPADELAVQIESVVKFHGFPVHDNGAIAIEITRRSQ
jgi:flagellar motor switch protein FliM